MNKNKYIGVIDYYKRLFKNRTITRETALWVIHAVILCAMRDDRITAEDYCYLSEYRDRFFE